jgi:competence protein ComEA
VNARIGVALAILAVAGPAAYIQQRLARAPAPVTLATEPPVRRAAAQSGVTVYVAGAVARPGVYTLPPGSRAVAALRAAGGALAAADLPGVNLAARVEDGTEIVVPRLGDTPAEPATAATHRPKRSRNAHARVRRKRGATVAPPSSPIDLNAAGAETLARVPGIGAALAGRIVTFREANGPFERLDDLLDVGGMSQRRLDSAEPYLRL